ncbi:MAG TPA: hypothetical protein DHW34_02650 [Actinobacteria bacterium]|nr:hypothetical protein [Actinomycetota bacterium]HCK78897.1 hypothetical protein [Actinomycetota bacterium]
MPHSSSMSNDTATTSNNPVGALAGSKGLVIVNGLVSLVIGLLLLSYPKGVLVTITFFLGLWLLISGVLQVVAGLAPGLDGGGRAAFLISGIASLILGLILVKNIVSSEKGSDAKALALVAILIGAGWLINGIARLFAGLGNPGMPGRGWTIFSGIVGIIAAVIVLAAPLSSLVVLTWWTAILLIVIGVVEIIGGLFIKRA